MEMSWRVAASTAVCVCVGGGGGGSPDTGETKADLPRKSSAIISKTNYSLKERVSPSVSCAFVESLSMQKNKSGNIAKKVVMLG